jgi:hypothetical protein
MLTYSTYAALLRLSRHSSLVRVTADRPALVELNNFYKNKCEIPLLASRALGHDLLFLRWVLVFFSPNPSFPTILTGFHF